MDINVEDMVTKIKNGEKVICPLCNIGYFQKNPNIPKQWTFYCSECKKKIVIN